MHDDWMGADLFPISVDDFDFLWREHIGRANDGHLRFVVRFACVRWGRSRIRSRNWNWNWNWCHWRCGGRWRHPGRGRRADERCECVAGFSDSAEALAGALLELSEVFLGGNCAACESVLDGRD
jgi:hypothetical protein